MHRQEFINKLKNHAIKGWHQYKILPSLTIAQAILETGWGKSSLGNNLFGIKADSSWTGKKQLATTNEYVNGEKITIQAWFRDYNTIYESLEDRYRFLQAKRYAKVVGEINYKTACMEIWKAGYATDPQYPAKLIQIIEQNNLQGIDRQAMLPVISNWALEGWNFCTSKGLIDGTRPKDNMTREEFAVLLRRVIK
ncbi:MAG: glycoside hydrolase family 73 protein [Bacillota bacterium]|nr:glycoside hydrolase family 73 protein [Bacillota bacterium]